MIVKYCSGCDQEKPKDEFYIQRRTPKGNIVRQSRCKECNKRIRLDAYYAKFHGEDSETWKKLRKEKQQNPEKKRWHKEYKLKTQYGLSLEQYEEQLKRQDCACYICKEKDRLYVDHNHTNGQIRKLLCRRCNTSLGLLRENVDTLKSMIKYIEEHDSLQES